MTIRDSDTGNSGELEARIAANHRRANRRKGAGALGVFAFLGTSRFVGLALGGTATWQDIGWLVSALLFGLAAIVIWRDSSRHVGA